MKQNLLTFDKINTRIHPTSNDLLAYIMPIYIYRLDNVFAYLTPIHQVSFAKSYCLSKFSSHTRLGKEKERKINSNRLFFFEVRKTQIKYELRISTV